MTLEQFIEKYKGKKVEYHSYSSNSLYQCADLANQYIVECLGLPAIIGTNAQDFPKKAGDKYDYILNTPDGIPKKGDIMIWKSADNIGHIAIFVLGDEFTFTSFDQNWPTGSSCSLVKHNYTNVLGWLRALQTTQGNNTTEKTYTQEEWTKLRAENQDNWDKWQLELGNNKTLTSENEGLKEERDSIKNRYNDLIQYIFTKCNPLKPLIDQSEDSAKAEIVSLVSNIDILNNEIKTNQKQAEKRELALVKENELLQGKLDTLQSQFDKMKEKHAQELETMQNKIDKVQEQVEANNEAKQENNTFKTWIENIIKKLKG